MPSGTSPGSQIGREKNLAIEAEEIKHNKGIFLDSLKNQWPYIAKCAELAGVKRSVVYSWRTQDKDFADAWDEIEQDKLDFIENHVFKSLQEKGMAGFAFPVLKAYRREKWGDKAEINGQVANITFVSAVRAIQNKTEDEQERLTSGLN